jgi:serine protease Do
VQDVREGSPADRAGIRPYDVIVSFGDQDVKSDDQLIQEIARRAPGTQAKVRLIRAAREESVTVKLAERPASAGGDHGEPGGTPDRSRLDIESPLGLGVRDLDATAFNRLHLPSRIRGALVTRVDAMSASFDADLQRNMVILEVNRKPVTSAAEVRRIAQAAKPGDVLAVYVYEPPPVDSRKLLTVRADDR